MKTTRSIIAFGESVEGYNVPVLNEREIRASAGIMFVAMFTSLMLVWFRGDFLMVKYVIIVFFTDFVIRVFVNPKFAPSLILGRLIVSGQVPEYVGARQKKFAWKIGLALSTLMFFLMVIVNSYSVITVVTCFICLLFLFFESAFGICLGCLVFRIYYKQTSPYCAGEVCVETIKQEIQKTSWAQFLILAAFIAYVLLAIFFFNKQLSEPPVSLWKKIR